MTYATSLCQQTRIFKRNELSGLTARRSGHRGGHHSSHPGHVHIWEEIQYRLVPSCAAGAVHEVYSGGLQVFGRGRGIDRIRLAAERVMKARGCLSYVGVAARSCMTRGGIGQLICTVRSGCKRYSNEGWHQNERSGTVGHGTETVREDAYRALNRECIYCMCMRKYKKRLGLIGSRLDDLSQASRKIG